MGRRASGASSPTPAEAATRGRASTHGLLFSAHLPGRQFPGGVHSSRRRLTRTVVDPGGDTAADVGRALVYREEWVFIIISSGSGSGLSSFHGVGGCRRRGEAGGRRRRWGIPTHGWMAARLCGNWSAASSTEEREEHLLPPLMVAVGVVEAEEGRRRHQGGWGCLGVCACGRRWRGRGCWGGGAFKNEWWQRETCSAPAASTAV
jgi:hypothetical protein